ncbi:ATP-binding cassette domain-containing protein [Pulveribacter sp.]|uniref:ATP-binding cassette domain-containing protein n=1 Tax=Pulveribacter sp. TaxID=2678893 RepID=UPI00289F0B94|nr:ATP-binding cassette domain-containing protein [Pulveribacter sp.]
MSLLRVENLAKSFGGVQAVQGISFDLAEGELLALIGPNGAGKTTTFNMAGGQLAPDGGRVLLGGRDITGLPPRAIWRLGVGRTFQIAQTLMSFTVLQNVQLALLSADGHAWRWWRRAGAHRAQDALALLAQVGMQEQAQRPCSELAYGDVKRVELAIALAHGPRLLLMDEPTAGMAPAERVQLMQLVRRIARERRMGVLFTEHSMDVVFGQADRVAVLVRGQLLAEGTPEAIRQDARVQAAYLGSSENNSCQRLPDKAEVPKTPLLAVEGLNAWYGAAHILHGVSLSVARGEVVALMGRNGAGKSTTLKSIAGLLARTEGRVDFMGQPLRGRPAHQIARAGLGYVPEDRRIFTDLTVLQNLETGRQPPRTWPGGEPAPHWTPERLFQLFPNLGEMPHRPGGRMSGGEQQMLTVARTLMGQPYLVLLDEPSEGVAPVIVEQMAHAIRALKSQGVGILLCEQNLTLAEAVADRACVLEKGRIVHEAPMAALAGDAAARRQYLGV